MEPDVSIEGTATIRVAVIPVGDVSSSVFRDYSSLVLHHKKLDLFNLSSFYKETQKSPFSHQPWKTGSLNFKFLLGGLGRSPWEDFQSYRKIHGVIGICHCPHSPDLGEAYNEFLASCKNYPFAQSKRCLAFDPDDSQVEQDDKSRKDLVLFPWADPEKLEFLMGTIIQDFAASVLMEFESWVLHADPIGAILSSPLEVQSVLTVEESKKRRLGRIQKAIGDYCMLAGSPQDAHEHYKSAIDLAKLSNDNLWLAGALEGITSAIVMDTPYRTPDLEEVVRERYNEVIQLYHKIPAVMLETEARLKLTKFLCRRELSSEVTQQLTSAVENLKYLSTPSEKQVLINEASQVFSTLGYTRKAAFFALQSAHLASLAEGQNAATCALQILLLSAPFYKVLSTVSNSDQSSPKSTWPSVQVSVLGEIVREAVKSGDGPSAWGASACLLRDHWALIQPPGQVALMQALKTAAQVMPRGGRLSLPALPFIRLHSIPPTSYPSPCETVQRTPGRPDWWSGTGPSGPFIYSPFSAREGHNSKEKNSKALWVVGEPCQVVVEVANPCASEVAVERLALAVSGDFHSFPVQLALPPNTPAKKVVLGGIPRSPGQATLIGCQVTIFGTTVLHPFQEASQNFLPPSSRDPFRGWDGTAKRYNPPPRDVLVLHPLPMLVARLAEGERAPVLFEGEERQLALTLTNGGSAPLTSASLALEGKHAGQVAVVDWSNLEKSLPLDVGQSVEIQIRVKAQVPLGGEKGGKKVGRWGTGGEPKLVTLATLVIHYTGPEKGAEDLALNPGRRLTLPLQFYLQRGLSLVRAQLLAMGGPKGERQLASREREKSVNPNFNLGAEVTVREVKGQRLLELDLWNGTDVVFDVSVEFKGGEKEGKVGEMAGNWIRKTRVDRNCCALVLVPFEPLGTEMEKGFEEGKPKGTPKKEGKTSQFVLPRNEAVAKALARAEAAANQICSGIKLRWHSGKNSVGELAIKEAVKEAIKNSGPEILLPDLVSFKFDLITVLEDKEGPLNLMGIFSGFGKDNVVQKESLSDGTVVARELTNVKLVVGNNSNAPLKMKLSVTCKNARGAICMGGAEVNGTVLASGCLNEIEVEVPSKGEGSHEFSVVFLVPGEYQLLALAAVENYKPFGLEAQLLDEPHPSKIHCVGLPHKVVVISKYSSADLGLPLEDE